MVAGDHPSGTQRADAFETGRRGDAEGAGDVAVGLPRIALQKPDDRRIKFVHAASMPPTPIFVRREAAGPVATASALTGKVRRVGGWSGWMGGDVRSDRWEVWWLSLCGCAD
ncbi:hypothetical protein GCM10027168_27150 [Streptomyces capparidis]